EAPAAQAASRLGALGSAKARRTPSMGSGVSPARAGRPAPEHSCGKLPDRVFGTSASTLKSDARGRACRPKASFPKEGLMKRIRMLGSQQNDRAHLYQTLNLRTVLVP